MSAIFAVMMLSAAVPRKLRRFCLISLEIGAHSFSACATYGF
jgi:hypothetical protein